MFINTIIIGIIVSICSNSWIIVWAGLEISLISFIPLLEKDRVLSTESSIKYFIIQRISSSIIILAFIINIKNISWILISYSIFIKIGTAPFHQWVIRISEGLTYINLFIILSLIKIPPLTILIYNKTINFLIRIISIIVGSTAGLNQISLRKILTYSSIYNIGYILIITEITTNWLWFILIYSIILILTLIIRFKINLSYINQISINNYKILRKLNIWILILSIRGMPPTIGFINKIIVIELIIQKKQIIISSIIILSSLTMSFYYTRIIFPSFILQSISNKWNIKINKNTIISISIILINSSPVLLTLKCIN